MHDATALTWQPENKEQDIAYVLNLDLYMSNAGHMLNRLHVELFPSARRQVWARLLCNGQTIWINLMKPMANMGNFILRDLYKRTEMAMKIFHYHELENVIRYL